MIDASLRARRRLESSFFFVIRLLRSRSNGATSSLSDVDVPSPGAIPSANRTLFLFALKKHEDKSQSKIRRKSFGYKNSPRRIPS